MTVNAARILELPQMGDARGNLTFVEANRHVPFELKRVFYLYDVPEKAARAGHALKRCHQVIVALSGTFEVLVDDGEERKVFRLDRADSGLYLPPLLWRELRNFSKDSVCLVLASEFFDLDDYLDEYSDFLLAVGKGSS